MPDTPAPDPDPAASSPPWNRTVKAIVFIAGLLLAATALLRFAGILSMVVTAALLAFLLTPAIDTLHRRFHLQRGLALALVYAIFAVGLAVLIIFGSYLVFEEAGSVVASIPRDLQQLGAISSAWLQQGQASGSPAQADAATLAQQVAQRLSTSGGQALGQISGIFFQVSVALTRLVMSAGEIFVSLFLVIIMSVYLAAGGPGFWPAVLHLAGQAGYKDDVDRLSVDLVGVWNTYLRGQVLVALAVFALTALAFVPLGVPQALGLSVLNGLLEFVPIIGQYAMMGIVIVHLLMHPSNPFGMNQWVYDLIVVGVLFLIQQIQGGVLIPRILGRVLRLPSLFVLVAVLAGFSLASVLGAILAAPTAATILILSQYSWRKLTDQLPFPAQDHAPQVDFSPLSLADRLTKEFKRNVVEATQNRLGAVRAKTDMSSEA